MDRKKWFWENNSFILLDKSKGKFWRVLFKWSQGSFKLENRTTLELQNKFQNERKFWCHWLIIKYIATPRNRLASILWVCFSVQSQFKSGLWTDLLWNLWGPSNGWTLLFTAVPCSTPCLCDGAAGRAWSDHSLGSNKRNATCKIPDFILFFLRLWTTSCGNKTKHVKGKHYSLNKANTQWLIYFLVKLTAEVKEEDNRKSYFLSLVSDCLGRPLWAAQR